MPWQRAGRPPAAGELTERRRAGAARLRAAAARGRGRPPLAHGGQAAGTRARGAGRGPADKSAGDCGPWRPGPPPRAAPARPSAPELRLGARGAAASQEVGPGRGTLEGTRGDQGGDARGEGFVGGRKTTARAASTRSREVSGSLQTKDGVSRVRTWG